MPDPISGPVAVCTGCGAFALSRVAIGQPCGASVPPRTRRCEGVFLVVMSEDSRPQHSRRALPDEGRVGICHAATGRF